MWMIASSLVARYGCPCTSVCCVVCMFFFARDAVQKHDGPTDRTLERYVIHCCHFFVYHILTVLFTCTHSCLLVILQADITVLPQACSAVYVHLIELAHMFSALYIASLRLVLLFGDLLVFVCVKWWQV
jgi:hypothetical protein